MKVFVILNLFISLILRMKKILSLFLLLVTVIPVFALYTIKGKIIDATLLKEKSLMPTPKIHSIL